jgi:pimeloyl-ACP methyl ester carboxylesterase
MDIATRQGFDGGWNSQVQCDTQVDPGIRDVLWSDLLNSDPVGATWGPGVRRAPRWSGWPRGVTWGWNAELAAKVQAPTLLISGDLDKVVPQPDVQDLYADLRMDHKVFANMACTSHFALWETQHLALFQASVEWLQDGSVNRMREGSLQLGE